MGMSVSFRHFIHTAAIEGFDTEVFSAIFNTQDEPGTRRESGNTQDEPGTWKKKTKQRKYVLCRRPNRTR